MAATMEMIDEEVILSKTIEHIKDKYPVIEVDSEIFYTANALHSKLMFRLQHAETKEILGITFDMKSIKQLFTTVVIETSLGRICEQLIKKEHTLTELQEMLNKYKIEEII